MTLRCARMCSSACAECVVRRRQKTLLIEAATFWSFPTLRRTRHPRISGSSSGDAGVGGEMTLDWALSQLSRFRDFKASLDESTSTLEAVEERPNGEEGGTE